MYLVKYGKTANSDGSGGRTLRNFHYDTKEEALTHIANLRKNKVQHLDVRLYVAENAQAPDYKKMWEELYNKVLMDAGIRGREDITAQVTMDVK